MPAKRAQSKTGRDAGAARASRARAKSKPARARKTTASRAGSRRDPERLRKPPRRAGKSSRETTASKAAAGVDRAAAVRLDENPEESTAPRPIWSGAISFGLVNVPVNLFPALRPHGVHLRMLDPSGTPLNRRYVSSNSGEPIDPDHIVRGYEVEKGKFVLVSDEELEALEPQRSREIDLRRFVDVSTIPPYYFERPYFLTPAGRSNKAYRLLAAVMEKEGKAGLATFVMREKEYLVAILSDGGILRAQTLRFADEIRRPQDVGLPERKPARAKQVAKIGKTIRDRTKSRLAREDLGDDVTAKLEKLIEKKVAQGRDIVTLEATPESKAEFVDLMEVLKQRMRGAA